MGSRRGKERGEREGRKGEKRSCVTRICEVV
jgi:hypothetical protein